MMMNHLNLSITTQEKNWLNPTYFILTPENINLDRFQFGCCIKNKVTNKSLCVFNVILTKQGVYDDDVMIFNTCSPNTHNDVYLFTSLPDIIPLINI